MYLVQFEDMIYDLYEMDAWAPPLFGKWSREFEKYSYKQWAITELKKYIRANASSDYITLKEYLVLCRAFYMCMLRYSKHAKSHHMFDDAMEISRSIIGILQDMWYDEEH